MRKTMLDYVTETPDILIENLNRSVELTMPLVNLLKDKNYRILQLVASGSSANAAWCARPMLRHLLGMEVLITPPHTFVYYESDFPEDTLTMVISQSGYSTHALHALEVIREQKKLAVGLTSDLESDMKSRSDLLVDYGCGREDVGYVTKGVATLALFLQMFAIEGGKALGRVTEEQAQKLYGELTQAVEISKDCAKLAKTFIQDAYMEMSSMDTVYLCGSGPMYGVAREGALKLCELLQIPAVAYETEEYIHGPELQMSPRHTVFFLDDGKESSQRTQKIWNASKLATRRCYLLTCNEEIPDEAGVLKIKKMDDPDAMPIAFLPLFQILAYQITEDLHLWYKHPLCAQMENSVNGKSENYVHKEVL